MKIVLIAPSYLPARRANTVQVLKMAQALTVLEHDVLVLVPGSSPEIEGGWEGVSHHYGLQYPFAIEWLPTNPCFRQYDYALKSVFHARRWKADLIYTRLLQAGALASFLGMDTLFELHHLPPGSTGPWLFRRFLKGRGARALVVITQALEEAITPQVRLLNPILSIIVAPDGVDLARYENLPVSTAARQSLPSTFNFQPSTFIAGYTGHLYAGRGINLILAAAAQLPGVTFLLVGGEPADVERIRAEAQSRGLVNVILTGFLPNAELPLYQAACDLLLMPYQRKLATSSGSDTSTFFSPMKVFEYMACGRPIISSDLPVLREVLNERNAVLLPPEDVEDWAAAIRELQVNPEKGRVFAEQAQRDAQQFSWEKRAKLLLSGVGGTADKRG
jgi:glycosyltransferase involved in cell wall biosynthesis